MHCSLQEKIEDLRQEMYIVAKNTRITDPMVIEISQKLDRLLNQYYLSQKQAAFVA